VNDPLSVDKQELRNLVDAIRVCLGKDPLYRQKVTCLVSVIDDGKPVDASYLTERPLPASMEPSEWFRGVASPTTRSSFRDVSVALALKRRALKFEERKL